MHILLQNQSSDFLLFFGRFHPLIVHLPIGILFLSVMLYFASGFKRFSNLKPTLEFTLLVSVICSVIAVISGFMLSSSGDYDQAMLGQHKWAGIGLTIVCLAFYMVFRFDFPIVRAIKSKLSGVLAIFTLIGLVVTGHLGGNLTHGSSYLIQYAPGIVKKVAGYTSKEYFVQREIPVVDSAKIFEDAVMKIFDARCISCHNPEKQKGALLLTGHEEVLKGGEHGAVINAGDPENSELIRRITLPESHEEVMPPEGKTPLTERQISIMKLWINHGAKSEFLVADAGFNDEEKSTLAVELGLQDDPELLNDPLHRIAAPEISGNQLAQIRHHGIQVNQLAEGTNLFEVDLSLFEGELTDDHFEDLNMISDNIVYLNLSRTAISNEHLKHIGNYKNLVRLWLNQSPVDDEGLMHITANKQLEYLNLYGTQITDSAVDVLKQLPNLKRLYVWQTGLTESSIASLKAARPGLMINDGV